MSEFMSQAGECFFPWLWRATWQASVVVVLVLTVQWLLQKRLTAPWRHALWFLVLVRLALPCSFPSPMSLFNWLPTSPAGTSLDPAGPRLNEATLKDEAGFEPAAGESVAPSPSVLKKWLATLWVAGALAVPMLLLTNTLRFARNVRRQRPVTDSALLGLLEDCKQELGLRTPITVVELPQLASPALFGFIRPRLLLPGGLVDEFSKAELRYVFLHELSHVKRADIPLNWLMTGVLVLHWFNPLVWFALARMRADRELACDALALSAGRHVEKHSYGKAILKLVERFSRPALAPGLVGILESSNQMKRRISMIAKFRKPNGWPVLAISACGILALVALTDPQPGGRAGEPGPSTSQGAPRILSTIPKVGETEVDPALNEISITFDRDMSGGFSWTGGPPDFPPSPEGQKAKWKDKRTCVLPVRLEAARYYRVGINSTSFRNFKSAEGEPVRPSAIYFTTKGASEALKRKVSKPMIVGLEPKNGATDVDPGLKEIRVTFNVPMGDGFSWTGGGEQFPTTPAGQKPRWEDDHKTCVLPVELKAGWEYHLGLNSPSHKNFQSAGGVPLEPVSYTFKTK